MKCHSSSKAVLPVSTPPRGVTAADTLHQTWARAAEPSAGGAADPAGVPMSLCAQVLVNVGAKSRKIRDLSVLLPAVGNLVGSSSSPCQMCILCSQMCLPLACALSTREFVTLGKLVMEELQLLWGEQEFFLDKCPSTVLGDFPRGF